MDKEKRRRKKKFHDALINLYLPPPPSPPPPPPQQVQLNDKEQLGMVCGGIDLDINPGPMDLETENRLAALLMEEARSLRLQAEKEGVHMYLRKPNVRVCPNSRFLTATVLGVQQANRAVEVSEMWHAREKELELDAKLKSRAKGKSICMGGMQHGDASRVSSRPEETGGNSGICSSSDHGYEDCYSSDKGGLRDEEVEEILLSRAKRGRGAIGSRMHDPIWHSHLQITMVCI